MRLLNRTRYASLLALLALGCIWVSIFPLHGDELDLAETDLKLPSPWIKGIEARAWSGYKDNVLLGNQNLVASPFLAGGLDLTYIRLPVDNWEALLLASAEYFRYLSTDKVDQEANVLVEGEVKRSFNHGWKTGLSAEYIYFNTVFDNSIVSTQFVALPVDGHGFTLTPSEAKDLGDGYRLELELPLTRQIFGEFIDSYWELGPRLTFIHEYGHKSDLSFNYQFNNRIHDTRDARDAAGNAINGRGLQFRQHELWADWRQYWGESSHWRTVTRVSLQRNEDNGGGYYDYLRPLVSEQVRYRAGSWEVRAEARLAYYLYDSQRIGNSTSPVRQKTYLRLNVRAEKNFTKSFKVFTQYEYERALSNLSIDEYTVNTVSAGVGWEF